MTKIAQINDRSAATAWSPIAEYADVIALGGKDSGGIGFEETGGELELFDMNLAKGDSQQEPTPLASIKTQSRFASLGWSAGGALRAKYPLGMLAGGMENGTVYVWNPLAMMGKEPASGAVIATFSQHQSGPVKALQFNTLVPTQLATGGSDGRVLIYNLDEPDEAPFMPCADGGQQRAQITALAWNTQVPHIVASAAADGTVSVWDVKGRKAWCELRGEAAGQAVADVAWNPTQGFHLLTASADDHNPVIKLWDLRASTSMPLATLAGHSQGIISMAWCPHDDHLLLSCGKDNRTILWDLYSMKPIGDVPNDPVQSKQETSSGGEPSMFGLASSQQRRYDVKWSPIKRGIVSTASLDRKVQIHSILGLSSSSGRPPKWMRPTSSVSCGFGGSIVSCGATDGVVRLRTVVEEPALERVSRDFEGAMDPNNVIAFCQSRALRSSETRERRMWLFMQVIFDANARQHLLDTLGFDPTVIAAKAEAYQEVKSATNGVGSLSLEDSANHIGMSPAAQDVVKRALMVGNFEAAVECCFRTGNLADALVLASCGGADLWTKTQERYFQTQSAKRPFLSVASAIIRDDLEAFVQTSDPKKWPETLAVLCTYGNSDQFPQLCVALGDLLEAAGDECSASLCYLCSLSLDKAIKFWRIQLKEEISKHGGMNLMALHEFVVKVSVFLLAVGASAQLSEGDAEIFSKYAEKLAEQGLLVTAAKYCVGDSKASKVLRDKLYRSRASQECLAAMGGAPPEFPFTMADARQSRGVSQQAQQKASTTGGITSTGYSQEQYGERRQQQQPALEPVASNTLPDGWMELQDPGSGRVYYANQTTGEVTWDRPQGPQTVAVAHAPAEPIQQPTPAVTSRNSKLASRYGDGFVSSASHPELASQYGNVGTTNPYHVTARPGIAQVPGNTPSKAPVSGNLETIPELKQEYQPISDTLLSLIEALKGGQLNASDKRQISEAEKAVAIFAKRLARGDIAHEIAEKMLSMTTYLSSYDWASANSVQTALVSQEWRDHKDWLKGIKALVQLATKMYSR